MAWLERWLSPEPDPDVAREMFLDGMKQSSTFGEPVVLIADGYVEQNEYESDLTEILVDWMAEAFSRARIEVHDENKVRVIDHPVERAYASPRGGAGPFWRGTIDDWVVRGLWAHGFNKTPGRRIYKVFRIPRRQLQIPIEGYNRDPIWFWTRMGRVRRLTERDFAWGIWMPDDGNEYNGLSPLAGPGMRNILRLGKAALKYEFDAFKRSGGRGLLIADPAMANLVRFKTAKEREIYRAQSQQTWEDATTGENRGAPIVTDGVETKVTEYGVDISKMRMQDVHAFVAERLLARFALPPSSVGIRIGRDPTYANSRTWENVAYERGVKPRQRDVADRLSEMLLTDVERRQRGYRVVFVTDDDVRAQLEDRQILERLQLDRLTRGAAAVWEVRQHLEGINPDPALEAQLQAAHMLRLTGASPQLTVNDPRLSAVLADAIELDKVQPLERLEGEDATVQGHQFAAELERLEGEISERVEDHTTPQQSE